MEERLPRDDRLEVVYLSRLSRTRTYRFMASFPESSWVTDSGRWGRGFVTPRPAQIVFVSTQFTGCGVLPYIFIDVHLDRNKQQQIVLEKTHFLPHNDK